MFDLEHFSLREMTELSRILRSSKDRSVVLEQVANRVVRSLRDNLMEGRTGRNGCPLVRFFVTSDYREIEGELGDCLQKGAPADRAIAPESKCLVLVASAGDRPAWNSREQSANHRAIPLYDEDSSRRIPMISRLLEDLGVGAPSFVVGEEKRPDCPSASSFDVFHVREARGSPWIPDQADFVEPLGIASVVGFGGSVWDGEIFAVVLFSRVRIERETAELFRTLALSVRLAVLDCDKPIFGSGRA